ncbi:restriction endonuclease subunit S [Shewanella decolorationis]|uniref:Restriction modification system DNA specificity domain protein n=1 Tax=Shewanella decolorationis S12 TaxID=1353536 RepID=A0ABN0PIY3_9GAMM|nr:restriction endonuclease subunit S [Shewanella decolorationis]ESE39925.1 restriction modification system DNA specificity domain protein [Shewanella decolorationis S12]GLR32546.1 hypothetical protein GCM10007922_21050 [Shewanella decolorationis]
MSQKYPILRFIEFQSEGYESVRLSSQLLSYKLGGNYSNTNIPTGFPLIKMGNLGRSCMNVDKVEYIPVSEIIDADDLMKHGDLFFNTRNTLSLVGKVAIWKCELPVAYFNSNLLRLEFRNNYYFNYLLNSPLQIKKFKSIASGTTSVAAIYTKDLLKLPLHIPKSDKEQQKIADFLTSVDSKISQLTEKHRLLNEYKKGVMQQLFSQRLRFKDKDGNAFPEWEERPLNVLASKCTEKNKGRLVKDALTNSAKYGIIAQQDYFDKDIANADNTDNYYVVNIDDFVYNPRISEHAPVGPIGRNHVKKGVMSPLYSVFRFKNNVNLDFIEYFFKGSTWYRYMNSVANFGARHDRMNISSADLMALPCPYPCLAEQQKIAQFLQALDNKITAVAEQIEQTKQFKKGLLQQMFV